jgi:hypothetical protein
MIGMNLRDFLSCDFYQQHEFSFFPPSSASVRIFKLVPLIYSVINRALSTTDTINGVLSPILLRYLNALYIAPAEIVDVLWLPFFEFDHGTNILSLCKFDRIKCVTTIDFSILVSVFKIVYFNLP